MKICLFATTILEHGGGLEGFYISFANELRNGYGLDVDIVTMDDDFSIKIVQLLSLYNFRKIDKSILYKVSADELKSKLNHTKYIKCRSIEELRTCLNNYDIVYSKNEILEAFIFKFLVKYRTIPRVIFGCHTSPKYTSITTFKDYLRSFLYSSIIYGYLTSGVSAFHVLNSNDEQYLRKINNKPVFRIPNFFDFERFSELVNKGNIKVPTDKFIILWIGVIHKVKGVNDLIDIIETINSKDNLSNKIHWLIVGDGQEKYRIEELASKFKNIQLTGYLPHSEIPTIISQSNLVISTSKNETFSFSTVEANSLNIPVVSYPTAGQSELIKDGENGFIVSNLGAYVDVLIKFINSEVRLHNSSTYIKSLIDNTRIMSNYLEMFNSVTYQNDTK